MSTERTVRLKPATAVRSEPMSLDAYRELVQRVMQDALSNSVRMARVFSNTGLDHARVVVETMLENAHSHVDIYSHELGVAVWNPEWFRSLIQREPEVCIRVMVDAEGCLKARSSALASLADQVSSGKIEVRRCPIGVSVAHISIVDQKHVRMEKDHATKKAMVAFGIHDLGIAATDVFNGLWEQSSQQ